MSRVRFEDGGKFCCYINPEYVAAIKSATSPADLALDKPSGQSMIWVTDGGQTYFVVDGEPDEVDYKLRCAEQKEIMLDSRTQAE